MKKLICVIFILISTLVFIQPVLLAREIAIDDTLKVELIDNKMNSEDARRIFSYAKSLYSHGEYSKAIKGFQAIIDYSTKSKDVNLSLFGKTYYKDNANLKDDALYYLGKCYYKQNNGKHVEAFEQLYYLFPDGNIIKTGQLKNTLINLLEKEAIDFRYGFRHIMRFYHLLVKIYPESTGTAQKIVRRRAGEECLIEKKTLRWSIPLKKLSKNGWVDTADVRRYIVGRKANCFIGCETLTRYVWDYFIGDELTPNQLKAIVSLVKEKCRLDNYDLSASCQTVKYSIEVKVRFNDLIKSAGINLFDVGRQKEDDI